MEDETPKENDEVLDTINKITFYSKKTSKQKGKDVNFEAFEAPEEIVTPRQLYRRRQSVIETVNTSFNRQSDKVFSLVYRNFLLLFRNPM